MRVNSNFRTFFGHILSVPVVNLRNVYILNTKYKHLYAIEYLLLYVQFVLNWIRNNCKNVTPLAGQNLITYTVEPR